LHGTAIQKSRRTGTDEHARGKKGVATFTIAGNRPSGKKKGGVFHRHSGEKGRYAVQKPGVERGIKSSAEGDTEKTLPRIPFQSKEERLPFRPNQGMPREEGCAAEIA